MTAKSTRLVEDAVKMCDLNEPVRITSPSGVLPPSAVGTVAPVIMEASSPLTRLRWFPVSSAIQAARQSLRYWEVAVGLANLTCYLFLGSVGQVLFYILGTER